MSGLIRVGLGCAPFPSSVADGLDSVERLALQGADRGALVVCFPESYIPGYPLIDEPVPVLSIMELRAALEKAREIARRCGVALILPMDWEVGGKLQNVAMVISADGEVLGFQSKNQLDPSEDQNYVPGQGRQLFQVGNLKFGVCICHEGFRYPETVRWAARKGASIVFHPHCTGSNRTGSRLSKFRDSQNPYYEQAMMCRALENTIYFASVNYAFRYPESATCVFGPQGETVAHQPYGEAGVLVVEIDPGLAHGQLAMRLNPERHREINATHG